MLFCDIFTDDKKSDKTFRCATKVKTNMGMGMSCEIFSISNELPSMRQQSINFNLYVFALRDFNYVQLIYFIFCVWFCLIPSNEMDVTASHFIMKQFKF